jgi:DNA gyrase/topoisomerase IV subunit A
MEWEWLKTAVGPLKDILIFLNKEGKTNDVLKKQLIRELRDNLHIFNNGFRNNVSPDAIIDLLSNEAYKEALKNNFKFKKLKAGAIEPYHILDERNRRYQGWDAEKLADKIDEKIEELKNIKKMNGGSVLSARNDVAKMLSNLFYRMKLLADFIKDVK